MILQNQQNVKSPSCLNYINFYGLMSCYKTFLRIQHTNIWIQIFICASNDLQFVSSSRTEKDIHKISVESSKNVNFKMFRLIISNCVEVLQSQKCLKMSIPECLVIIFSFAGTGVDPALNEKCLKGFLLELVGTGGDLITSSMLCCKSKIKVQTLSSLMIQS